MQSVSIGLHDVLRDLIDIISIYNNSDKQLVLFDWPASTHQNKIKKEIEWKSHGKYSLSVMS